MTRTITHTPSSRCGFTLLEVLIAITLVVILGAVVGINLIDMPQRGRQNAAKLQLASFKTAIQIYINDNGAPPTQRQGLEALVSRPTTPPIPQSFPPERLPRLTVRSQRSLGSRLCVPQPWQPWRTF